MPKTNDKLLVKNKKTGETLLDPSYLNTEPDPKINDQNGIEKSNSEGQPNSTIINALDSGPKSGPKSGPIKTLRQNASNDNEQQNSQTSDDETKSNSQDNNSKNNNLTNNTEPKVAEIKRIPLRQKVFKSMKDGAKTISDKVTWTKNLDNENHQQILATVSFDNDQLEVVSIDKVSTPGIDIKTPLKKKGNDKFVIKDGSIVVQNQQGGKRKTFKNNRLNKKSRKFRKGKNNKSKKSTNSRKIKK